MRRPIRRAVVLVAGLLSLGGVPAEPAQAQETCVQPAYIRRNVSRGALEPITLRWLQTTASPGGVVQQLGGGQILTLGPLGRGPITETIVLPQDAIQRALQSGQRQFVILRSFFEDTGTSFCVATLQFAGPLGGPLDVSRIQLRFDVGSPLRVVPLESELVAWADLVYTGGGELEARWEVAFPESTAGAPAFVLLQRVRRQITGGGRVSIESPPLPTTTTGLHLVRFVIDTPTLGFVEPDLRYYVTPAGEARVAPAVIAVSTPAHNEALAPDTTFRWQKLDGARAYRLEIHPYDPEGRPHVRFDAENPSFAELRTPSADRSTFESFGPTAAPEPPPPPRGDPVAGMMVSGDVTEARLSAWAFGELEPGRTYVWTVRGLAAEGIPVGLSAPRLLRVPAAAAGGASP